MDILEEVISFGDQVRTEDDFVPIGNFDDGGVIADPKSGLG